MKNSFKLAAIALGCAAVYVSCSNSEAKKGVGIDVANFDSTVAPSHDFFHFANGGWIKKNPIPADQIRWGSFSILNENNKKNLHQIVDDAAAKKDAAKGTPEQLVGDFYFSAMDTATIEKLGADPIRPEMENIDKLTDITSILHYTAMLQKWGASPMYGLYAGQDPKNSEVVVPQLYQGGLSLPDRDFYISKDARSENIRSEFLKHMVNMFKLYGMDEATSTKYANVVMRIETALAKASMTRVELRDPFKTYNKVTIADLNKLTPSIRWDVMMNDLEIKSGYDYLVLGQPEFMKELENQVKTNSVDDWKIYLKWNVLNLAGNVLSSDFVNEDFNFNNKILSGQKEIQSRWKRMIQMTDGTVGDALGQLYVAKYFPPDAKKKADELVSNLIAVYNERIDKLDWMSAETKVKAKEKLNAITRKIGYPDKWKDYAGLEITRNSFFKNLMNATAWDYNYAISQIGKPVDRTKWGMTPPTVNAYYNPSMNEIVFPAGILQPPFFNAQADDAVNYGGIGAVIGHELTHGFDDEGRNFDAKGNLNAWWTSEDSAKFVTRAQIIIDQFDGFTVLDTLHVNGHLTLGENIADLGGITIAYDAFKRTKQGQSKELIDGMTPEQRFFLGFATIWAGDVRPETAAQRIITDPHSPGLYRVNGPLSNIEDFYKAFNVTEKDAMYRPDSLRAKIW
ncbi:MAG: M13 family metallopeptidase [Bacteroidetes bacterium]|nr:M13 family metallopeptidase [Candidatus Brachybacter algidus]MBK6988057.1 M13 family metallopeptidase [Bacteroidota bacterium]MBK7430697.1 M13 family metallopeptidase [Bacteroidota bacterium]MBK8585158.1 M13 family metallopeptidase [Bacteroidota bacterium]MBK8748886.1 M13 family metallopeptidase [Candidatus Brachybacter algidus]